MATTVTKTNLFSEARNNVVALISENVTDPLTSASEYRKFIYSRRPDVKSNEFNNYPLIIVYPSDVSIDERGSLNEKSKMVTWGIEIEVITSDRGNNESDGNGLEHMDIISDSLISVFADKMNRTTLRNNGIAFATPTSTPVTNEIIHNQLVYIRSFMYSFRSRKRVSD